MRTRNRHRIPAVLAALAALLAGAACGGGAAGSGGAEVTELRYQGWVGQVLLPELAADLGYLGKVKLTWIGNTISGPQDIQSAATGQVEFGGAFNGAIVKLAAAKAPITAVVGYYGTDAKTYQGYYVTKDSPIRSARDLVGKKVGMNTLGAHAEAVLKTYLRRGRLGDADIDKVESIVVPPVNIEQSLRQGQIQVGVLGGLLRDKAVERGGLRPLFSDYDIFGTFTAGSYVFRDDFIKKNPGTVKEFVAGVAKAIEWVRSQPPAAVTARYDAIIAKRGRSEDNSQTRYFRSLGVAGKGGLITDAEFGNWIQWLRDEGELSGDVRPAELYTNEFNPFADGGAA
ncbi:MAG TPA: ABC transporter substrate-binding protein [Pilimelia sp.]|nr:ABC transporter substrate-binding protein [Pilimelia sp.]